MMGHGTEAEELVASVLLGQKENPGRRILLDQAGPASSQHPSRQYLQAGKIDTTEKRWQKAGVRTEHQGR